MKYAISNSSAFVKALMDAGVIPPNCKRAVIDIQAGQAVTIFSQTLADRESLESESVLTAALNLNIEVSEQKPPAVINITVNGASDPAATAEAVADHLRRASPTFRQ